MQAMILAAGLGTRLLPHTLVRPKPLFPILNKPLLILTIKRLQRLGFDHIVVNCHHLREQIVEAIAGLSGVIIQEEEQILGTGGGLRKAVAQLRDEPLLVTNGDIYHTVDLLDLYNYHLKKGNPVTLAMHDYPRFNSVKVQDGEVRGIGDPDGADLLAFTGLHVIEPIVLMGIKENSFSCIIACYRELLGNGGTIGNYRSDNCFWTDMGTAEDYLNLHQGLLGGMIPRWRELGEVEQPFFVAEKAILPGKRDFKLKDWVCIGNAEIGANSQLEKVVVWDGVQVPANTTFKSAILSS